jgi:DNA-binding NtrC family response regulator
MNRVFRTEPFFTSISLSKGRRCEEVMVLLLDDDDAFRTALSELLRDDGHPVTAYRSIAELPPLAEIPAPAAMITDYQLGTGEDGLSLAHRFSAAHPGVPVILVTAFHSDYLAQAVAATPHLSLLRKPLQYEELHEILHQRTTPAAE